MARNKNPPTHTVDVARAIGHEDLIVDRNRGTLLNTNRTRLAAYKARRNELARNKDNDSRISNLETRMDIMQALLTKLSDKYNAKPVK